MSRVIWLDCPVCHEDVEWSVQIIGDGESAEAELSGQECECIWDKHVMDDQRDKAAAEGLEDAMTHSWADSADIAYDARFDR